MSSTSPLFHRQILDNSQEHGSAIALLKVRTPASSSSQKSCKYPLTLSTLQTDAETGEQLSFDELRRRSFILARFLRDNYQVRKGDVLLCYTPNSIHYPIIFLAGALLGASQTGVNPEFTYSELSDYIKKTECRCIFTTSELLDSVSQALKGSNFPIFVAGKLSGQLGIDLERIWIEADECDEALDADADVEESDVLLTPLSSGTTGMPKCVMLTHRNFNVQTEILKSVIFNKINNWGGQRTTIAVLPFYHASGFWALCYCLLTGHQTVVMQRFQAPLLLSCIEDYRVDTLNLVPSIVMFLLKNDSLIREFDLSSVRIVLCGSAPILREQTQQFLERYPNVTNFINGYGMTEIVALSHLTPLELPLHDHKHMNSFGQLLPGFECKVVDLENGQVIGQPMQRGELWLRSECVMKGYLRDPEATQQCLDANGWYHTGDIVYFDDDQYYYVVDRIKNVLKVNGLQEGVLLSHEEVVEAAVVGVPMEGFGEVPRAFVVLKSHRDEMEMTAELKKFVNSRVASHKQLRGGVYMRHLLPKSAAGKVLKEELKRWIPEDNPSSNEQSQLPPVYEALKLQMNNENGQQEPETFL